MLTEVPFYQPEVFSRVQTHPVTPAQDSTSPAEIASLLASWRLSLAARRVSPATIATYSSAVLLLRDYLAERNLPTAVDRIRREHVEAFITDLLARRAPSTAHNRHRGCAAFFAWLVAEGELTASPMARMKLPRLPEAPVPILRDVEAKKLIEVCVRDKSFVGRRDEAIIRILLDSGIRRAELLGLRLGDVNVTDGLLTVTGKGSRTRVVAIGMNTSLALDRYLRSRSRYLAERQRQQRASAAGPADDHLWVGRKGALGQTGIAELLRSRARQAGLSIRLFPHLLRHTWAHNVEAAGMAEGDVMALAGWRSRSILARYAASTRQERAIAAARTLSHVDRLEAKAK
jgi:site-specific recombinase XerD